VVAIDIHGLLAKRAGRRSGEDREAEQPANTGEIDTRGHDGVLAISRGRQGRGPGVGMIDIELP
jgi:hypothetical protein